VSFALASAYLRVKKLAAGERLFAEVLKARPLPATYVLIGRTYRDAVYLDQARTAFETALKKDPRARRAHYYLGTLAVLGEGVLRLDEAIAEFRQELKLAPDDPVANLRLGMALVEAQRPNVRRARNPRRRARSTTWAAAGSRSTGHRRPSPRYARRCGSSKGLPSTRTGQDRSITSLGSPCESSASRKRPQSTSRRRSASPQGASSSRGSSLLGTFRTHRIRRRLPD